MTVKRVVTPNKWVGLSTDTKPTQVTYPRVRVGDTFYEYDSDQLFITYDGATWVKKDAWTFGKATLMSNGNSSATWTKGTVSPFDQKGSSGYVASLYGGSQSGTDWARVNIPVNEMLTPDLRSALWSYHMSASDEYGCNMVIWVHDPADFDKRAEITQSPNISGLIRTSGWNAHALDITTNQFWFMGEGTGATGISVFPAKSGWDDFQTDVLFKTWTIYRITFEFGWYNTGTFGTATVADIEINGQIIPLQPAAEEILFDKMPVVKQVAVSKIIDASIGGYAAGDVVSNSDCTTSGQATAWNFANIVKAHGRSGTIINATLFSETKGKTPRYLLRLYNASPSCNLIDNTLSTELIADRLLKVGEIDFPATESLCATTDASTTLATPSTIGNVPLSFQCASGDTDLYGVLITRDSYTHGATDDITIVFLVEQF